MRVVRSWNRLSKEIVASLKVCKTRQDGALRSGRYPAHGWWVETRQS